MYPKSVAVYTGSRVIIKCNSSTRTKWTKLNYPNWKPKIFDNNLLLDNIQNKDNGYYVCTGTYGPNNYTFKDASEIFVGGKLGKFLLLINNMTLLFYYPQSDIAL